MARGRRKTWFRAVLIALAVLTLLPIGGVLMVAVFPPAPTILMLRQAVRGEGMDYQWRGLNRISPNLVNAAIAAEDARFCSHHGFDMEAIEKALDHNAAGGRIRGGSTISQQTAKNVFLWPGRDWIRKGFEAGYTVLIEAVWSKRRIMEVYLNVVEWAPGVYGAHARPPASPPFCLPRAATRPRRPGPMSADAPPASRPPWAPSATTV
jgi:monofunctional glycosyltransferase